MKPVLFYLGPLPVYSFGFLVASGVLLSLALMSRKAKGGAGLKPAPTLDFPREDLAFDMVFVTVLAGFLGARLYYVLQNAGWYFQNPLQIFAFWEGGLIFYGGQAGALLGIWIFFKIKKIAPLKGLDFILPYVALTQAFGRIGCFLNGCCTGKACELPWAVQFPALPSPVHPAQLYEAVLDFLLFFYLNAKREGDRLLFRPGPEMQPGPLPRDGEITALYFAGYALIRFAVEFSRADNPVWGILTVNQWISGPVFLAALVFYLRKKRSLVK